MVTLAEKYAALQTEKTEIETKAKVLEQQNAELQAKIQWYEEQLRLQAHRQYGRSSEKSSSDQLELPLFNEAEITATPMMPEPSLETVTYERKRKKKQGQRNLLLRNIPVETTTYRLPEEEQACLVCEEHMHEMSTEVRQEITIIPAKVHIHRHERVVYACRNCEKTGIETPIVTAPMPAPVQAKSLASPSAVAHIIQQKYVEGVPLYRQESQWKRMGVQLSRQTMANWVIHSTKTWLLPLYERMKQHLCQQDIAHADETTLRVLSDPGNTGKSNAYMWLYRTGHTQTPIVLYEYQPTRKGAHPKQFLAGFQGYLHVDGYAGYNRLADGENPAITLVGCWAHARRKFDEALRALPAAERTSGKPLLAEEGLAFCNDLFRIEKEAKDKTVEDRLELRLKKSKPVLDAFAAWLQTYASKVLPKSKLGEAITYCQNQWHRLTVFLADGRLEMDNNRAERSIKPFVIGRKNWLFANSAQGATASAIAYSIVETAKENGLNPFPYVTYVLQQLPNTDLSDTQALDQLLPWSASIPAHCRVKPQAE